MSYRYLPFSSPLLSELLLFSSSYGSSHRATALLVELRLFSSSYGSSHRATPFSVKLRPSRFSTLLTIELLKSPLSSVFFVLPAMPHPRDTGTQVMPVLFITFISSYLIPRYCFILPGCLLPYHDNNNWYLQLMRRRPYILYK